MKIILVKEKEDGFFYEVVKVIYRKKAIGFTFKVSTKLNIFGRMIADETDKDKQNEIINDFNNIKDIFYSHIGEDIDIGEENKSMKEIINTYLTKITTKYGLILIDFKKDKDFYQCYKKGIYKRVEPITQKI